MCRYFLEVGYKGTRYSGFQVQENANTIQGELERAMNILFHSTEGPGVKLTGSSRTDAGVHAIQNFFHFDFQGSLDAKFIYKLNAILPHDIAAKNIHLVSANSHARFDALSRMYEYRIYRLKNPFYTETAYYYPYQIDFNLLIECAQYLKDQKHFYAFSKMNTSVNNYECTIYESEWIIEDELWIYHIVANRFLRGMVRLLTATMLQVARGKLSVQLFKSLFDSGNKCGFSIPSTGLFLKSVNYPDAYFTTTLENKLGSGHIGL